MCLWTNLGLNALEKALDQSHKEKLELKEKVAKKEEPQQKNAEIRKWRGTVC